MEKKELVKVLCTVALVPIIYMVASAIEIYVDGQRLGKELAHRYRVEIPSQPGWVSKFKV